MNPFTKKIIIVPFTILILLISCQLWATSSFPIDVKEFRLKNGMLFLVVERDHLPQVSFRLAIRAGSCHEDIGCSGIAHMVEHMLFKGTKNFGNSDPQRALKIQNEIEGIYEEILRLQSSRNPDKRRIREDRERFLSLLSKSRSLYIPNVFSSQLSKNGAVRVNAYTTKDMTIYMASLPSDMLEQWFSIVSEQIFEPAWWQFFVEKEVVEREWEFRYLNSPESVSMLELFSLAFRAHPYGRPVIGWIGDIRRFSLRDAKRFHSKYYNPTNSVCVIVGDVNISEVKRLASIYFERYPKGETTLEWVTPEPVKNGTISATIFMKGIRRALVRVGFRGPKMGTSDFYAMDIISTLLSGGRSSRFTKNIINKGLAVNAWAANPDNRYGALFILGGSPGYGKERPSREEYIKGCKRLEEILISEAERLKEETVSERELEKAKTLIKRDIIEQLLTNESIAERIATLEVQIGWSYLKDYLSHIQDISSEDISEAAKRYIDRQKRVSVYVIPGKEGIAQIYSTPYVEERMPPLRSLRIVEDVDLNRNRSIYPTPDGWRHPLSFERVPRKIEFPRPKVIHIHKVPIFYIKDNTQPIINLSLYFKAGEVDIPEGKAWLSMLFERTLIKGGTKRHGPEELLDLLDRNGIDLDITVGMEMTVLRITFLKEKWAEALSLLLEILSVPRFDSHIVKIEKGRIITNIKRQGDDPFALLRRESLSFHFRGHPYGRSPLKGLNTIPKIDRADIRDFMRSFMVQKNLVIGICGELDEDNMIKDLEKIIRSLPHNPKRPRELKPPSLTPSVFGFINKPGQVQAHLFFLFPGVPKKDDDYWRLSLLSDIIGGGGSLLYRRLREEKGLAYAVGFYESSRWEAGLLSGYIGCDSKRAVEAIDTSLDIFSELRHTISQDLFDLKKRDKLNGFIFNVEKISDLIDIYCRTYIRGDDLNILSKVQDIYMNITKGELEEISKRYLDTRRVQIFIVADGNTRISTPKDQPLFKAIENLSLKKGIRFMNIPLR